MPPPSLTTVKETNLFHVNSLPSITFKNSTFLANNNPILTHVPPNITVTPPSHTNTNANIGCFVGFNADDPRSRHVVPIGNLNGIKFTSIFRFKLWWSTQWTGTNGNDIEHETQMMILENDTVKRRPYVLFLPLIEGSFRASLQPGHNNCVDICMESGSTRVTESTFKTCLYIHVNFDPYNLMNEAIKVIRDHLGTFKLLEEKTTPDIVDKFGWCTWDAFYLKVDPQGIKEGIKSLVEGGCPPGFIIIDDGWQNFCRDDEEPFNGGDCLLSLNCCVPGEQMLGRLISFEENKKFKEYRVENCDEFGLGGFVKELKEEFGGLLKEVYVWHALCGYWGGIRPNVEGMPESVVVVPKLSPGAEVTMTDLAVVKLLENGVGLVKPQEASSLYQGLHSHLQSVGVDGVKIDVTHVLEMVSEEYGGRVEVAKAYYKALTDSVRKHFKGNGVISSMQQCNDFMFLGTQTISLGRVGDDFWCTDPAGDPNGTYWLQGCHIVHCAYNSLWMGNFIHPDWDMFQSNHPCSYFHAASRAISGGPIYVSDSVGNHNFNLLHKIVLPDGSILRCQHYALPTIDSLFHDPLHDGKTMLKIWNLNKYSGVLGLFNCQGGGWCPVTRRNKSASEFSHSVTCVASPKDIEWNQGKYPICIKGVDIFAVYMFKDEKLKLLKYTESIEVSLEPFSFDLLTVSPVMVLPKNSIQFAPIGLVNMLNSGGSIMSLEFDKQENLVRIGVRGHGKMKVFASEKPVSCMIDGEPVKFDYDGSVVMLKVLWPGSSRFSMVEYLF
ncbi:galactinol--sucrose galactosyltransferase-like [Cicer arietinum]|uniref:galactinol--sucrose galactosyltransferase n=1 Tax=Cicer arietinum TaxID=3827 RepID=A0A1S2Z6F7_CICAR|nr:galactinol--sucrose galactosyltransferase-like [Cicer arietinum]